MIMENTNDKTAVQMPLKRYDPEDHYVPMEPAEDGGYVDYNDHLAALEAGAEEARREAAARIAELEEKVRLYTFCMNTGGADKLHARIAELEAARPVAEAAAQADDESIAHLIPEREPAFPDHPYQPLVGPGWKTLPGMPRFWPADFYAAPTAQPTGSQAHALAAIGRLAAEFLPTAQPTPPDASELARLRSLAGAYEQMLDVAQALGFENITAALQYANDKGAIDNRQARGFCSFIEEFGLFRPLAERMRECNMYAGGSHGLVYHHEPIVRAYNPEREALAALVPERRTGPSNYNKGWNDCADAITTRIAASRTALRQPGAANGKENGS